MTEELTVTTERVDDIPILLVQGETMGSADLLDTYFKPHGNCEAMSLGWTTAVPLLAVHHDWNKCYANTRISSR